LGESFYNPRLKATVQDLIARGLARGKRGRDGGVLRRAARVEGASTIIQKSDGAANYTTTDLATLAYRLETWHPDEIIYVTDARQQLHFKQALRRFPPNGTPRPGLGWRMSGSGRFSARTASRSKPAPATR